MKLSEFRTLARATVPGAKTAVVTNAVLDLILNNGANDVAAYTLCLKTNKKFTVTAEVNEYILSTAVDDYLGVDKPGLWWNAGTAAAPDWQKINSKTLAKIDEDRPTWRNEDSDDPQDCSIDGDILTLVPTPDTTLTSGLWLYYGRKPVAMVSANSYPFSGSTTEYPHLSVFDDAILAYFEWQAQKILNKGQDQYKLKETAYIRLREEKFSLFKRRLDISNKAKLQGRKVRS